MLPLDVIILFVTRSLRMFSYGAISVVLFLYLQQVGLSGTDIGSLLTSIVLGDLFISLFLTSRSDSTIGRRLTLIVGAVLMCGAGLGFVLSGGWYPGLLLAGTLGVISGTGGEIGPFLPVEQAALADSVAGRFDIGPLLGYYSAAGSLAQALGALCSGWAMHLLQHSLAWSPLAASRTIFLAYAALGGLKVFLYSLLSTHVECPHQAKGSSSGGGAPSAHTASATATAAATSTLPPTITAQGVHFAPVAAPPPSCAQALCAATSSACSLGLHSPGTRSAIAQVSALFILDGFAGGLVMQTYLIMWFARVWGWSSGLLGSLIMGANVLGGLSSILAGHLVQRYGAVNTAVASHFPSNLLLAAVPLMPTSASAAAMLLARFCISQMDVPARQAYVQGLVQPSERSAAGGVANVVRSLGLAAAPLLLGALVGEGEGGGGGGSGSSAAAGEGGGGGALAERGGAISYPFFIAAALKCVYDVCLLRTAQRISGGSSSGSGSGSGSSGGGRSSSSSSSSSSSGKLEVFEEEEELGEGRAEEVGKPAAKGEAERGALAAEAEEAGEGAASSEAAEREQENEEREGLLGKGHQAEAEEASEAWTTILEGDSQEV